MDFLKDTICAIATPPGIGGIAILRISGADALPILKRIFRPARKDLHWESHRFVYGHLLLDGKKADECMAVFMKGPRSYTAEDVCEIQCHGGSVPARMAMQAALKAGARLAQSGEFTKRAFLNGRLDLSSAEAVMDLISSRTQEAALSSLARMGGSLQRKVHELQDVLTDASASLEAYLDYPEDDVEETTAAEVLHEVNHVQTELQQALTHAHAGLLLRDGLRVAIVGRPNVGKSSLLNALLGEDRAIVTEEAGTTRDTLTEFMQLSGIPVLLTDTAGIRESEDRVEKIGVERARSQIQQSDVVLWVLDSSIPLSEEDRGLYSLLCDRPSLCILNKGDLDTQFSAKDLPSLLGDPNFSLPILETSAKTGEGLSSLQTSLRQLALQGASPENAYLANERHIECVQTASHSLTRATEALQSLSLDVADLDIREAWQALGSITGETAGEAVIDRIFEKFCLGK